jgi:hypothetical protein
MTSQLYLSAVQLVYVGFKTLGYSLGASQQQGLNASMAGRAWDPDQADRKPRQHDCDTHFVWKIQMIQNCRDSRYQIQKR